MTASTAQPLLTVREAAVALNISVRTAYELIGAGKLPAFRVGGQLRVSNAVLEEWLAGQATRTLG